MSESTLSLQREDLLKEVAYYRGWTRAVPTDAGKLATCEADVRAGLRRFYFPPPIAGRVHEWSFLKPPAELSTGVSATAASGTTGTTLVAAANTFTSYMVGAVVTFTATGNTYTIDTVTDDTTVELTAALDSEDEDVSDAFTVTGYGIFSLPDDFGYLLEPLNFTDGQLKGNVRVTGESQIRTKWAHETLLSYPQLAHARFAYATTGQRGELLLWPKPDAIYTLHYRYGVLPDALTSTYYPYGGMQHAETIKAACLAEAEVHVDGQPGAWEVRFQERLAASMIADNQNVPDRITHNPNAAYLTVPIPTYNGVAYPG